MGSLFFFAFPFCLRGAGLFLHVYGLFVSLYALLVLLHSCCRPTIGYYFFFLLLMFASCKTLSALLVWSTVDATIGVFFC